MRATCAGWTWCWRVPRLTDLACRTSLNNIRRVVMWSHIATHEGGVRRSVQKGPRGGQRQSLLRKAGLEKPNRARARNQAGHSKSLQQERPFSFNKRACSLWITPCQQNQDSWSTDDPRPRSFAARARALVRHPIGCSPLRRAR